MDYRERVLRTMRFEPVDSLPFRHAYGLMPGVLEDWYGEGLPRTVITERNIYEYFGFPPRSRPLPISCRFDPPFEERVLEDTPEYRIAIDGMGRKVKLIKASSTLPLALEFPVRDRATWEDYKRRLERHPARVGAALEETLEANRREGLLNVFGNMGFFWFPRDLMGDENLCIAYFEQAELVHDMLETWCALLESVLTAALERGRLDMVHFGEDMAYRNASLIGKAQFDEFLRPYYLRIRALVDRYEVPIFSVDSDGCLKELLAWFADCGVNLIGPNEVMAGNDIVAYRKRMETRMAYDGGLEKRVLLDGPEAIDRMLESTLPAMKASGGGWIICLDHRVVRGTTLGAFQHYVRKARDMARF